MRIKLAGLFCLLLVFIMDASAYAEEWEATVAGNGAFLYRRMDTNSTKESELPFGTQVIVSWTSDMSDGQWCAIKGKDGYDAGYVNCRYLTKGHLNRKQINAKGVIAGGEKITVLLYSRVGCPYSRKAEQFLRTLDINLIKYDIRKDKGRRAEMKMKGGSGVPFIDIEGIYISGNNQQGILSAIERKSADRE